MKRCSTGRNGKCGYVQTSNVELPLSKRCFEKYFVSKLPKLKLKMNHVKERISVGDLRLVVGEDCAVYRHKQSSTEQKIVDEIKVSYAPKRFDIYSNQNCER